MTTVVYHPSPEFSVISKNPIVSIISISNPYNWHDLNYTESVFNDVNEKSDVDDKLVNELTAFTKPNISGKQPIITQHSKGRFTVTKYNPYDDSDGDLYEDAFENPDDYHFNNTLISSNCNESDDDSDIKSSVEHHIDKLLKAQESRTDTVNTFLGCQDQLWNIIIPIYFQHSGADCCIEKGNVYFDEGTIYPQFNVDFLLRNNGFFMEIMPTYDDFESWDNMPSANVIRTLKTFGLTNIDENNKIEEIKIGKYLKFTMVLLESKPKTETINSWKCFDFNSMHLMSLSGTDVQYPLYQVIEKNLYDVHRQKKPEQFDKSKWCKPINISRGDHYINGDSVSVSNIKERFGKIKKLLKEKYNFDGFTMADIWLLCKEYKFIIPNFESLGKKGAQMKRDKELAKKIENEIINVGWHQDDDDSVFYI